MAEFSRLMITEKGQALIAKMLAGSQGITFTKVSSSDTAYEVAVLETLESLTNIKQTSEVSKITRVNENTVKIETAFSNTGLTEGYFMRALGLYAEDPDEGEILYAATVETSGNCYMPAYSGITVSGAYIQLVTTVGNAENVSIEVSNSAQATIGDIKDLQGQIDSLSGTTGNIVAQVETNTAKLEALADLGSGGISQRFSFEGTLKTGEDTTVFTFDSAKTDDLLEENAWYSWKLKSSRQATGMSIKNLTSCGIESTEHIVGYIELLLRIPNGSIVETQYCPFIPTDTSSPDYLIEVNFNNLRSLINKLPDGTYLNGFGGWYITAQPHVYEKYIAGENNGVTWWYHKELNVEINLSVGVDFTALKIGYDMSTISGGGELPEIGGTDDYTELENKPSINGVTLEGDLTSEQLGLGGGTGTGGVGSLTDLGVTASADELNYMSGTTSNVQEQLDNKAPSNHAHSGYASSEHEHSNYVTTETIEQIDTRLSELEEAVGTPTTFVYSDTVPTEVAENTIVMVYETE